MNSALQQCDTTINYHQKVLIQSFHSSGHTFRFHWTAQDLSLGLVKFHFGSERVKANYLESS